MAFVNCHKCNARISDLQEVCPHCGQPLRVDVNRASRTSRIGYGLFYVVMSFVLAAASWNYKDSIDTITTFLNEMAPMVVTDGRVTGFMVLSYGVMTLTVITFLSGLLAVLRSATAAHIIMFLSLAVYICMALLINEGDFFEIDDDRFVPHSAIRATICLHLALWPMLVISMINALMAFVSLRTKR